MPTPPQPLLNPLTPAPLHPGARICAPPKRCLLLLSNLLNAIPDPLYFPNPCTPLSPPPRFVSLGASPAEAAAVLARVDSGHTGDISFDEFVAAVGPLMRERGLAVSVPSFPPGIGCARLCERRRGRLGQSPPLLSLLIPFSESSVSECRAARPEMSVRTPSLLLVLTPPLIRDARPCDASFSSSTKTDRAQLTGARHALAAPNPHLRSHRASSHLRSKCSTTFVHAAYYSHPRHTPHFLDSRSAHCQLSSVPSTYANHPLPHSAHLPPPSRPCPARFSGWATRGLFFGLGSRPSSALTQRELWAPARTQGYS